MNVEMSFKFIENITSSKKDLEPILIFHTEQIKISKFFDYLNNEEIEELDRIYEYSKKFNTIKKYDNTINRDTWFAYRCANNIEIKNISSSIIKNIFNYNENNSLNINIRNKEKNKTISFPNKDLYNISPKHKPTYLFNVKSTLKNLEENAFYLQKRGVYKNDKELLYIILNCIFESNNTFYIKKCKRSICNKYFLTIKVNKECCERTRIVCEKVSTCCDAIKTLERSKQYKKIIRLVDNFLSKYRKKNDENSILFIGEFKYIIYNEVINKCKEKLDITINDIKKVEQIISNYRN